MRMSSIDFLLPSSLPLFLITLMYWRNMGISNHLLSFVKPKQPYNLIGEAQKYIEELEDSGVTGDIAGATKFCASGIYFENPLDIAYPHFKFGTP